MQRFWNFIVWVRCKLGHPDWFDYRFEKFQGYRRARGFVWEKWRVSLSRFGDEAFDMWLVVSEPTSETTYWPFNHEPLIREDYR